ncbi:MAG: putative DNA-binding domain-containing protein, partial [Thermoanaerobaculia bacterium]|nr:putative DNA-binding domain-containing protein [Thermoanaerobaculia bacterium]
MQSVIVHPGNVEDAVRARSATRHLKVSDARRAILPSKTMEPLERLAVYQGMYPLRMRDALAADYPGLAAFLGHERFFDFVRAYVAVHPSRSYTFARLGVHVPEFLRKTRRLAPAAFLSDLARLEQAINEVFELDEEEAGHALPAAPPPRHVATDWESRRFAVSPTLRLLSFRYAAGPALDALKAGKRPGTHPRASWAAVHRRRYAVYRVDLRREEFLLLSALAKGRPLGAALRAAARASRKPLSPGAVTRAFRIFTAKGLLGEG